MPTATLTKPGTPKLSEVARRVHAPVGIVSTGWPAVDAKCSDLGIAFRWWQPPIGRLILAKRADGLYASTIGGTGLSIPRQVGKTFLVAAIMFALCLLRPGFTVLWTAHRLKTAEETFGKLQVFAKRRKIAPHIRQVKTGSGEQQIIFRNGSRILFGARERGFGRGFDEVDALVFDEAQHMTDSSLDDMVPATNQSRQPEGALMLFMGTPPRPQDPGEVFKRMRADAEAGDEDTGWVEFGADQDYSPTPLPAPLDDRDWGQIAAANPSFPDDTSRTAVLRLRKKLGDDSFLREGLGIWTSRLTEHERLIEAWSRCASRAEPTGQIGYGVATAPDHSWSAITAAWVRDDGRTQVEVVDYQRGTLWLPERVAQVRARQYGPVAYDAAAAGAVPNVKAVTTADRSQADNALAEKIEKLTVCHAEQPELDVSVRAHTWKTSGETRHFDRKGSTDISPLVAAALAVWTLTKQGPSTYEERGLIEL